MTFKEILDRAVAGSDNGIPWLIEMAEELDDAEEIKDEILYQTRWSTVRRAIYRQDDRYWAVEYERPATEMQEWHNDGYECYEVQKATKTVVDYIPIAKAL